MTNHGTEDAYPALPTQNDPRWRHATVMAREELSTELLDQPHDVDSAALWLVHRGDMIWIMREIRYHHYVAAKVGYHVGWLNMVHVKPKLLAPSPDDVPIRKLRTDEWLATKVEPEVPQELLTTEAESVTQPARTDSRPTSKDVSRIIRFLQGFAGALSGNNRQQAEGSR